MNYKSKCINLVVIILFLLLTLNTFIVSNASSNNVYLSNSKYNSDNACWEFTVQSNSNDKIYYSFIDNEKLNSKCKYITSGQIISIPSSLIKSSYKTLRLFILDKRNNIVDKMYYRVNIIARNKYMNDLNKVCNSIYNQQDNPYIKAKKLYAWIGENKQYEFDGNTNHEYGALYGDSAACSGFAKLYVDMCLIAGIKCEYVSEDIVDYKYVSWHAWNHIYLNDKIYFVDPTWSGVCFENKVDFSHFCNNGIVNHTVTEKYDLSSDIYDNYNESVK